jgi:hypothetical protein
MNDSQIDQGELMDTIRNILLKYWDPILIEELPEDYRAANSDEYDDYIEPILRMIADRLDRITIEGYLSDVESRLMGLRRRSGRAALAAQALFELEAQLPRNG